MLRIRLALLLSALFISGLGESISLYWGKSFAPTAMAYQKPTPQQRSPAASANQESDVSEWREALMFCKVDQVQGLLAKGANVNAELGQGVTPLMRAAGAGCVTALQLLIEKGAPVNAKDRDDKTAFIHAAQAQGAQSQIIAVLIAPMSAKPTLTDTLLMRTVLTGNAENVQALLAKGNDPNAKAT